MKNYNLTKIKKKEKLNVNKYIFLKEKEKKNTKRIFLNKITMSDKIKKIDFTLSAIL